MNQYVDFVLCKHENSDKTYLFRAPAFSGLKKGNQVIVDTKYGQKIATVVSSVLVDVENEPMIDFIMNATHAESDVKKVLSKVVYQEMDYSKEDEDERTDTD